MSPQKPDDAPAWAIALLAAILEPEATRSQEQQERGGAVRRAQQFIDEVPKLLNLTQFKDLSKEEMGAKLRGEAEERDRKREKEFGCGPGERISFEKGVKLITGTDRPTKALERWFKKLLQQPHEYIDYEEQKQATRPKDPISEDQKDREFPKVSDGHDPLAEPESQTRARGEEEINAAFASLVENGFTPWQVECFRKRYREMAGRSRAKNLLKKKKKNSSGP
jgi:hypothetical protein